MERIDASAHGRVEVAGRWFGVRGRRFVRPTLTLSQKGAEVRALAELEHKPWAAKDGEVWTAVFSVDKGLDGARDIELSVAPDIVVELRPRGKRLAKPGDSLAAGAAARSSRFKADALLAARPADEASGKEPDPAPVPRRRPSQSAELERLGARLAAANDALVHERERRATMAGNLEEERTTNRHLRTELGQARSELEVAAAARAEAAAMEEELNATRRELRETQRRHEEAIQTLTSRHEQETQALTRRREQETQALTRRHEELAQAHAAVQEELHEHVGALESVREALAAERAEAGRLRNRLTEAQEAPQRGGAAPTAAAAAATARAAAPTAPAAPTREARASRRAASRAAAQASSRAAAEAPGAERPGRREPDPSETQRFDVLGLDDELGASAVPAPRPAPRRSGHQTPDNPPTAERLRPLNPSLRHRTWWFGRLLVLIVLCGVIAAVWVVLHSTVLH